MDRITEAQFQYRCALVGAIRASRGQREKKQKQPPPTKPPDEKKLEHHFKQFKKTKVYDAIFIALTVFHGVPKCVAEKTLRRAYMEGIKTVLITNKHYPDGNRDFYRARTRRTE